MLKKKKNKKSDIRTSDVLTDEETKTCYLPDIECLLNLRSKFNFIHIKLYNEIRVH